MAEGGRRPPGDGGLNVHVAVDLLWGKTWGWSEKMCIREGRGRARNRRCWLTDSTARMLNGDGSFADSDEKFCKPGGVSVAGKEERMEGAYHLKEGLGDVFAARGSGGSGGFMREWGEIVCRGRGWT
jgi:hypothetical protein